MTVGMNDDLPGGRQEGVNELGLFIALSAVPIERAAPRRPGAIFHLVPSVLLETCASAGEATMLTREMPHMMSYAYLVADPDEMFIVDAHPGLVRAREPENRYIADTNPFLHPDLQNLMRSPVLENSEGRLLSIRYTLSETVDGSDPWNAVKDILIDNDVPLFSRAEVMATLWSMVADLTNYRLAYSLGAPCRNEYRNTPWPRTSDHILSGRSRTS